MRWLRVGRVVVSGQNWRRESCDIAGSGKGEESSRGGSEGVCKTGAFARLSREASASARAR